MAIYKRYKGRRLKRSDAWDKGTWWIACEKAGFVNLRFHETRHTFATRLRANGVHEWDIRDLLGHASVSMTSVYTHQTPANLCKAVNTLGQTKLGKLVRFQKKNGDRSTNQIAPSSRHVRLSRYRTNNTKT
jgi:hypothetical protein